MTISSILGTPLDGSLHHVDIDGSAPPGARIEVALEVVGRSVSAETDADADGRWSIRFGPGEEDSDGEDSDRGDRLRGFACGARIAVRADVENGPYIEWGGVLDCAPAAEAPSADERSSAASTLGAPPVVVIRQPADAGQRVSVTIEGDGSVAPSSATRHPDDRTAPEARRPTDPDAPPRGARPSPVGTPRPRSGQPAADSGRGGRASQRADEPSEPRAQQRRPAPRHSRETEMAGSSAHDSRWEHDDAPRERPQVNERHDSPPERQRHTERDEIYVARDRRHAPDPVGSPSPDASRGHYPDRDSGRHLPVEGYASEPGDRRRADSHARYDDARAAPEPRHEARRNHTAEDDDRREPDDASDEASDDSSTPWLSGGLLAVSVAMLLVSVAAQGYPILFAAAAALCLPLTAAFASSQSARGWALWAGAGLGLGVVAVVVLLPMVSFVQLDTYLIAAAVVAAGVAIGIGVELVFGGRDEASHAPDDEDRGRSKGRTSSRRRAAPRRR